jgi:cytoskeleton protein RodZ
MTESTARPDESDSPGALIRAAREKQGLHIAALAAAIKVSPRKLDALENDRWHELPDATFSRALAQTVCRTLKIDPRPVLERLPPADSSSLEQVAGTLNTPFQDGQGRAATGLSAAAIRPMVWASALLALAAVVVYFLPAGWLGGGAPTEATSTDTVLPPLTVPAPESPPAATAPPAVDLPASAAAAGLAAASGVAASPVPGTVGETVFSVPSPAEAAAVAGPGALPTAPASAEAAPAGLVQLRASDASWVEARDAGGQLLLSRTVLPGESVGLNGALPMRLVIGNAGATELGFRGRPVDLTPLTRDNVARVELR